MTLKELCEIANTQLIIRYPSIDGEYYAIIENAELKLTPDDPTLQSCAGYGNTADNAIYEMINYMRGKILVVRAMGVNRITFKVPETLSKGNL
jgi:hypothetical protein